MHSYQGQLLIAMPGMPDERFTGTVSLICRHNEQGAMALVLNRLIGTLSIQQVLKDFKCDVDVPTEWLRVHQGGPVLLERGFMLHGTELDHPDSQNVTDDIAISATTDALMKLVLQRARIKWRFALGCASWSPGQLENELRLGGWLLVPATRDVVFRPELSSMWGEALKLAGVRHSSMLVAQTGTA